MSENSKADLTKSIIGAIIGGLAGIIGTLEYVERRAKETQSHASSIGAHSEKLKNLKEELWYAKGERESLSARIKVLEIRDAKRE